MSDRLRVFIKPARQGSFTNDVLLYAMEPNNLFVTSLIGVYAVATATDLINAVIVKIVREVCGAGADLSTKRERWLSRLPSGDLEALVDRIEPSMQRAHNVIGEGANKLLFKKGQTEQIVFDETTKAYVNSSILDDEEVRRVVRVGALNANSGNGRVYLPDVGKTVPYSVVREPEQGTYANLAYSLDRYVRGMPSDIEIVCREVLSIDNRVKKLIITSAVKIIDPRA